MTANLDVALVQSWVNNPASNFGIVIANTANIDSFVFVSREGSTASQRPKLEVTYSGAAVSSVTPANQPPTVAISGPLDGASYVAPATIDVSAMATDDGSVST
ncbi:MAG: DNRLRE domain-containing protein [Nitrospiraceae bacterium]